MEQKCHLLHVIYILIQRFSYLFCFCVGFLFVVNFFLELFDGTHFVTHYLLMNDLNQVKFPRITTFLYYKSFFTKFSKVKPIVIWGGGVSTVDPRGVSSLKISFQSEDIISQLLTVHIFKYWDFELKKNPYSQCTTASN